MDVHAGVEVIFHLFFFCFFCGADESFLTKFNLYMLQWPKIDNIRWGTDVA